eukprot:Em0019g325a
MQRPLRYRAARNAAAEELPRKIRQWAVDDMYFSAEDLPSEAELKMFLGRDNVDAWLYITEHIRSPRTTEELRGNLSLQSASCGRDVMVGGRDSEMALLLDDRQQLQQEMHSTQVAISQLEKDITRLRADISQIEGKNEVLREGGRELVRKAFLMSAHTMKCAESIQVVKEFTTRIVSRPQLFRHNLRETTYFARTSVDEGGAAVALESACTKQLRGVCEQMESLVHLHDNPNISSDEMDRLREKVWSLLEQVVVAFPPGELVDSMVQLTSWCAEDLRSHTSAINLQRDSQQLQYRFVGGEVMCEREEEDGASSLLRTVHDHIQGLQLDHIERAVRSEVTKRNSATLQERLSCLKRELDDVITKSAGPVEELVRMNLHLDLEHMGCEGALETLQVACAGLREAKEQCQLVLNSLQKKRDQIKEFTQLSESKQALIQCLVKHNSGARQQLCDQQTKLVVYIKENVCAHEVSLLRLIANLTDGISRELALFSSLLSARLLLLHKLSCSVGELSISVLRAVSPLHSVLQSLGIPAHCAADQVLVKVAKMFDKAEALRSEVEETKQELRELRTTRALHVNVKDIVSKVEHYDTCRAEEKLPLLQTSMLSASQALAQCVQVQQALEDWWEQPAQFLTPWVMYEGMEHVA